MDLPILNILIDQLLKLSPAHGDSDISQNIYDVVNVLGQSLESLL